MPPHQVYFYESPYHENHYVLTLSFCFDKEEEGYQFAYSYPYSYSKHQAHLENIEQKNLPHFKRELLANSLQKRRIDIITITNPENMGTHEKIRVVIIFSRIHPGDSPTSYICQVSKRKTTPKEKVARFRMHQVTRVLSVKGKATMHSLNLIHKEKNKNITATLFRNLTAIGMIDFLISNHPIAETLRRRVIFKFIPMINPDGVVLGNFRSNWLGSDFERYWSKISQWSHPPLHAAFETITNLNKDKNVELDFVVDLHAHSSLRGIFVHGNTYQNVYRQERHILFPKLLSQNVDGYEPDYCVFNRNKHRRNTCRRFFSLLKESINCYSIYASFYGYIHKETQKLIYFDEESYYRVGRNIVRTFSDYYRYVGAIPSAPKKIRRKSNKQSIGHTRRKKLGSRVAFSRIRKKTYKRHRRPKPKVDITSEISVKELQSKADVKKGRIDFSNVIFPPISDQKTIKRKLLPTRQQSIRDFTVKKKEELSLSSDLKILKIA